jgi:hypothetical protein
MLRALATILIVLIFSDCAIGKIKFDESNFTASLDVGPSFGKILDKTKKVLQIPVASEKNLYGFNASLALGFKHKRFRLVGQIFYDNWYPTQRVGLKKRFSALIIV